MRYCDGDRDTFLFNDADAPIQRGAELGVPRARLASTLLHLCSLRDYMNGMGSDDSAQGQPSYVRAASRYIDSLSALEHNVPGIHGTERIAADELDTVDQDAIRGAYERGESSRLIAFAHGLLHEGESPSHCPPKIASPCRSCRP